AEAFRQLYLCAPDAASTGEMLHVAALSDEAETYAQAVETAVGLWHAGKLPSLAASNLEALIESEYWVLAPEARASGAGFMLKQTLADARRQLQSSAARRLPPES
ncbi:MAG TPA: hypothetical protein VNA19_11595, partial [Pyrinomonadaceae bacterium]|nr:hypothetical protein [Pyrinomonadaceae bacterium]